MYASHSRGTRTVGLGAAFLVNGVMIGALVLFVAPSVVKKIIYTPTIGVLIPETDPPPPIEQPKPVEKTTSQEYPVVIPKPVIQQTTDNVVRGTEDIPVDRTPPIDMGTPKGDDVVTREPVTPPLPPLIVAQIDPRYANAFQPDYPTSEIRAERDGTVSVRVLIGADGRVKAVEQVRATSPAFFEATKRQALSKWRFKPATRGGTPQESWKVMNVRFEMTNAR